jgi:hypothetical protein
MEVLKNHTGSVQFIVPTDLATATYTINRAGAQIGSMGTATVAAGMATVNLPWAAVAQEGPINICLQFFYQGEKYEQTSTVTVATPYLPLSEVKTIIEDTNEAEATRAEAAARYVINAHCGQSFGKTYATYQVKGNQSGALQMPAKLLELTGVNGLPPGLEYQVSLDGLFINYVHYGVPPVKADYYGLHQHVGGVIHNPNHVRWGTFESRAIYSISGWWGYNEIPEPVREAARILVENYADPDSEYRDRYLTSMTAADWRIQFNDGAFAKTGNVRADQLLESFVMPAGWLVF